MGENEGAKFWLKILTEIQNRGVKDILIACIDNLTGFAQAIESIFPNTQVQLCIVHQIRSSTRYVASKDRKKVVESLKQVYKAPNKDQAEIALSNLDKQWAEKYPSMVNSWLNNWDRLSNYFQYPNEIRRIIYTTNIIESFHSQLRKVTKTKRVFSNDMALLKLLYLVQNNLKLNWVGTINGWNLTMSQLLIIFEDRMKQP